MKLKESYTVPPFAVRLSLCINKGWKVNFKYTEKIAYDLLGLQDLSLNPLLHNNAYAYTARSSTLT